MEKKFAGLIFDNLTDNEYEQLRKMKCKKKNSQYKIIITSDRCDYDDLSELMNYPELGKRVGTFYFNYPEELELILKAFEGLFYQLFKINETERMGGGVMDDLVFEDWWELPDAQFEPIVDWVSRCLTENDIEFDIYFKDEEED